MMTDWTSVVLVVFLFGGLIVSVLSAVVAAVAFRAPFPPGERPRHDVMAILEEMGRKTAAVEKILKQLAAMQVAVQSVMDVDAAKLLLERGMSPGPAADFRERRTVYTGS